MTQAIEDQCLVYARHVFQRAYYRKDPVALGIVSCFEQCGVLFGSKSDGIEDEGKDIIRFSLRDIENIFKEHLDGDRLSICQSMFVEMRFCLDTGSLHLTDNEEILEMPVEKLAGLIELKNSTRSQYHIDEARRLMTVLERALNATFSQTSPTTTPSPSKYRPFNLKECMLQINYMIVERQSYSLVLGLYTLLHIECLRRKYGIFGQSFTMWSIEKSDMSQYICHNDMSNGGGDQEEFAYAQSVFALFKTIGLRLDRPHFDSPSITSNELNNLKSSSFVNGNNEEISQRNERMDFMISETTSPQYSDLKEMTLRLIALIKRSKHMKHIRPIGHIGADMSHHPIVKKKLITAVHIL